MDGNHCICGNLEKRFELDLRNPWVFYAWGFTNGFNPNLQKTAQGCIVKYEFLHKDTNTLYVGVYSLEIWIMASINEEIKQKTFRNEHSKLMINILFTSSWLNSNQNQVFKKHDLTPQQFNSLRILRGQYPNAASVIMLKDRMIDKMSNVSRIIDKLKSKELVTRKSCKEDRRQVDIKITQKGLDLLTVLDEQLLVWEKKLTNISEQEAEVINGLLDKWRG